MALLLETGDVLLLESGDAILEEDAGGVTITPDPELGYGPGRFRVWIAFGTEAYDSDLEASDTPWIDVTVHVREARFATSSRSSQFDTFTAGYGSFTLDNSARLFDPAYAAGTYYGDFKRHVPIRVTGEHSGTRYTVWRGWVRNWQCAYDGRFDSVTRVSATDALGVVANYELDVVAETAGGQEPETRIALVLGLLVGFPGALTVTEASGGVGGLASTTLGENALAHLVAAATADGGHMYADRDGKIHYDSRAAPALVTRMSTSQASLDDTTEPAYDSLTLAAVGDNYRDLVRVSGSSGVVQEVDNSATDAAPVVFQKLNTPLVDDSAAAATAAFYADLYSTDTPHPTTVTVTVATRDEDLRTVLLPRQLRDRVDVTFGPPGGGADIAADVFIDGIEHDVTPDRWRVTYRLSSADAFDALAGPPSTWLVVGDATLGKVGTGTLAY